MFTMKLNIFQKILFLSYLILIAVTCILFVPFTHGDSVYYHPIWSDSSNIDITRICFYLILFTAIFYMVYKYLNRMNNLDPLVYKKKARTELRIFVFFIGSILFIILLFVGNNLVNSIYRKYYITELEKTETLIREKSVSVHYKEIKRRIFWNYCSRNFVLTGFQNNIDNLWQYSMSRNDLKFLKRIYNKFPLAGLRELNIKSPKDLGRFFKENNFSKDEQEIRNEIRALNNKKKSLSIQNQSLEFFGSEEISKPVIFCFIALFGLLYFFRPAVYFIKGMFSELN